MVVKKGLKMKRITCYQISPIALLTFLFIVLITFTGCNSISGSGIEKTEKRVLKEFSSIKIEGAYAIEVVCGKEPDFTISGDDNLLPLIKTEVTNSSLKIYSNKSLSPSKAIKIKINLHTLTNLSLDGANSILVSDSNSKSLICKANGAGTITIQGKAKSANFTCNGAVRLVANDFKVNSLSITLNGTGKAAIHAIDELVASVNGVGKIDYFGNPKSVTPTVNGLGKINKR